MSDQITIDTGAAAFIGFHVAPVRLAEGRNVVGLDCLTTAYDGPVPKRARLNLRRANSQFSFLQTDLMDCAVVAPLFARRHLRFAARTQKGRFPLMIRRTFP